MLKSLTKLASAAALASICLALPAQADADDQADLLRDANRTVNHLRSDPAFGTARTMLQGAEAIYIVPKLVKGGFIFGAEGGEGAAAPHRQRLEHPALYDYGLQRGLRPADRSKRLNWFRHQQRDSPSRHRKGEASCAGAGTVVTLSSGAEGATTAHGGDAGGVDLGHGRLAA
jgi:hypothetical protein